jgi:uncharacterized protein YndB with AHSA1/START domain
VRPSSNPDEAADDAAGRTDMTLFDVQAIEIAAPCARVFDFVRDPRNLPRWAQAFEAAELGLHTDADPRTGTIDWRLEFPDGTSALAQSRVTPTARGSAIYSFVLHAPPVPLAALEGALAQQKDTLRHELATLKALLEGHEVR